MNSKISITHQAKNKCKPIPTNASQLGFGRLFTDHMFVMDYRNGKWLEPTIIPYDDFHLDPATLVLHYGQGIFEGLKAYKNETNIFLFRPDQNLKRMNASATRMMMPTFDEALVLDALKQLCILEKTWIPDDHGHALYLRPTMIATEVGLGVRPSLEYRLFIIASPVGAYYANGYTPIKLMVTDEYVRAAPGGAGAAKTMGNYATSMLATHEAQAAGFNQVLWLDAIHQKYIEEVGVMNFFAVIDGVLTTPQLTGTILPGVTRDSVIELVKSWGISVVERQINIDELTEGMENGTVTEIFGSGTAAVISPVSHIHYHGYTHQVKTAEVGELTQRIFDELTAIQYGKAEDPFNWVVTL